VTPKAQGRDLIRLCC